VLLCIAFAVLDVADIELGVEAGVDVELDAELSGRRVRKLDTSTGLIEVEAMRARSTYLFPSNRYTVIPNCQRWTWLHSQEAINDRQYPSCISQDLGISQRGCSYAGTHMRPFWISAVESSKRKVKSQLRRKIFA
jgi:hypothetical protein